MIDVKQIFETVILSEKLGNLNIVSDRQARKRHNYFSAKRQENSGHGKSDTEFRRGSW